MTQKKVKFRIPDTEERSLNGISQLRPIPANEGITGSSQSDNASANDSPSTDSGEKK